MKTGVRFPAAPNEIMRQMMRAGAKVTATALRQIVTDRLGLYEQSLLSSQAGERAIAALLAMNERGQRPRSKRGHQLPLRRLPVEG